MSKTYTPSQIKDFYDAQQMQIEAGIIASHDKHLKMPTGTSFETKITMSLYRLYEQVTEGEYDPNWRTRKDGHAWLSYDKESNVYVYDTRNRSDEWSDTLVDNILSRNQIDNVKKWISFLSESAYNENMKTACEYYELQGGYFSHIRSKYAISGIVTAYEYDRLVRNKYTTKVITALRAEAKFPVGSLADLRSTHEETKDREGAMRVFMKRLNNGVLILSNTEPILSACVGAKRYKAVCVGDTTPFYIEERFLKKKKKIKTNKK